MNFALKVEIEALKSPAFLKICSPSVEISVKYFRFLRRTFDKNLSRVHLKDEKQIKNVYKVYATENLALQRNVAKLKDDLRKM